MGNPTIDSLPILKLAYERLPDPTYIVDLEFNLLWVNTAYRRMMGYRPRKRLPCHEVVNMGVCGTDDCLINRCVKQGHANGYLETDVAGSLEPDAMCLTGGMPLIHPETGEVVGAVGIMRDTSAEVRMHKKYGVMLEAERNRKEILEREVAERTSELVEANAILNSTNDALERSRREIVDILENISQAILTVADDLTVGQEYSRYSERVFGREDLAGTPIHELIAGGPEKEKERKELVEWLKLIFHSPTLNWKMARSMVQEEFTLKRDDGRVSELKIDFEPIREEGRIKRLMVLVEDLTEKRELQRAIDAKQSEMDESLEHLAELARLDPEMYEAIFEEANEIVEHAGQSLATLGESSDKAAVIDELFRNMHTLKGNAMAFGLVRVAAKAHWVEDAFSELRESAENLSDELIAETREKVTELGDLFARIQNIASKVLTQSSPQSKDDGSVRSLDREVKLEVDEARIEALLDWVVSEMPAEVSGELRSRIRALTLVPLSRLYGRFPKMVDDLADNLGKTVNPVELSGGDVALAAKVFNKIGNALVHLVRNCVDHGIEESGVRIAAGKPSHGTIALKSSYEGDQLCIEVSDDGGGVDPDKLVRRAIEKGLIDESEKLSRQEALQIIFKPGFSTAAEITDTSGRGVGMDAVKTLIEELGGTIHIDTELGVGTKFSMRVPARIAQGE